MDNLGTMTLLASILPIIAMVIGLGVAGAVARLTANPWGGVALGIVTGGATMIVLTLVVSVVMAKLVFNESVSDLSNSINQNLNNAVGEQSN